MKAGRRAGTVSRRHRLRPMLATVTALALAASLSGGPVFAAPADADASTQQHSTASGLPFEAVGKGPNKSFAVEIASGRADTVSGGDALVRVEVPRNVPPHHVRVAVDGRDLTDRFQPSDGGRTLLGLVDGLALGDNQLTVRSNGRGRGRPSESVTLTNHPAAGPVLSGPHIPLYCTADGPPWNLGPVDENPTPGHRHPAGTTGSSTRSAAPAVSAIPRPPAPAAFSTTRC